jgi:hypothetical protein
MHNPVLSNLDDFAPQIAHVNSSHNESDNDDPSVHE